MVIGQRQFSRVLGESRALIVTLGKRKYSSEKRENRLYSLKTASASLQVGTEASLDHTVKTKATLAHPSLLYWALISFSQALKASTKHSQTLFQKK